MISRGIASRLMLASVPAFVAVGGLIAPSPKMGLLIGLALSMAAFGAATNAIASIVAKKQTIVSVAAFFMTIFATAVGCILGALLYFVTHSAIHPEALASFAFAGGLISTSLCIAIPWLSDLLLSLAQFIHMP